MNKKIYYFIFTLILLVGMNYISFKYKFYDFKKSIKDINKINYTNFIKEKKQKYNTSKNNAIIDQYFDFEKAKMQVDTTFSFGLFHELSTIISYDDKFYDCLDLKLDIVNHNLKLDSTISYKLKSLKVKHGEIVDDLFKNIGIEKFVKADSTDIYCHLFFDDMRELNIKPNSFKDFESYIKTYTNKNQKNNKSNSKAKLELKKRINQSKYNLTKEGKEILTQKTNSNSFIIHSTKKFIYKSDVLGDIIYNMDVMNFDDVKFNNILNEIYKKQYSNNSLVNGAKPYAYCFGSNNSCNGYSCSQISVKTPNNSDVLVTIKRNNKVYRHAYIKAGREYTFNIPDGNYQTFFYYGKGWNPFKVMTKTNCGNLKGGFTTNESFGKDRSQYLNSSILSYELILQRNGNFSTSPSNASEAF